MKTERPASFIAAVLNEHPALMFSALYLIASLVGMLFSWDYLRHFGINVFNYAQIGDFLLASLKEPMTWGLVILSIMLALADNASSRRWQKKARSRWTRWYGSPRYRMVNYFVAIVMVAVFIDAFAYYKARKTYAGSGQVVSVRLSGSESERSAILLDTTAQFVFLFDATTKEVTIHPNENIEVIALTAPEI